MLSLENVLISRFKSVAVATPRTSSIFSADLSIRAASATILQPKFFINSNVSSEDLPVVITSSTTKTRWFFSKLKPLLN